MGSMAVILPAAGRSTRFGDPRHKKIYADLDGRAVWLRAIEPFINRPDVARIVLAIHPEDRELFERRYRPSVVFMDIHVIDGGAERHDTVAKALDHVPDDCEFVAVHDAARPCVTSELIDRVLAAAREHGAALPGLPVVETLKRVDEHEMIVETVPRTGLVAVQTPQIFRREWLVEAYSRRERIREAITDDAQLVEALGHPCRVVEGSRYNIKITTAEDLRIAEAYLKLVPRPRHEGTSHPFADERAMWGGTGHDFTD